MTIIRSTAIAVLAIGVAAIAGCGSVGAGPAPQSQGSPAAAVSTPPPATTAAPCTSNACIADVIDRSLVGSIAKDDSVMTKIKCKASTVKQPSAGIWTATCTVTYSDGDVARGIGTADQSEDKVTFEPTSLISGGS